MFKLGPQRGGEAADRVLGAAIGRLKGNSAVSKRRADVDDLPARLLAHMPQRRHRAMDDSEIGHLRHAAEFFRRHFADRREDGQHRVVDPHVYGSEFLREPVRGGEDGVCVAHIDGRGRGPFGARRAQFIGKRVERGAVTRDQPELRAFAREQGRDSASDAGAGSGDDDHFSGESLVLRHRSSFQEAALLRRRAGRSRLDLQNLPHATEHGGGLHCIHEFHG